MQSDRITLNYQRNDDILYVTFGLEGRKGMGFNLHDNILPRFDRHSREPLGLTFIDYSELKALHSVPLNDLSILPQEAVRTVRQILLSHPVSRFLEIDPNMFSQLSVINPTMEKVIAA